MKKNKFLLIFLSVAVMLSLAWNFKMDNTLSEYKKQGNYIVKSTFDTLSKTLMSKITTQGIEGAVSYCSEKAYPITAQMAKKGIEIRRVAEKNRNPKNALTDFEKVQWTIYNQAKQRGDTLGVSVFKFGEEVHYFKPIILQAQCVVCHGQNEVTANVEEVIKKLYPNDKARGFAEGDLRGMWHITFKKQ